ncbi:MAG: YceD family protein [Eubacteriales bacterium]|jgi:uncharacterized protein
MLDLNSLLSGEKSLIPFEEEFSLEDVSDDIKNGRCIARGKCINFSGYIEFSATLNLEYTAVCSRCGEEFNGSDIIELKYPVAVKLENADKDQDEYLIAENGMLDEEDVCLSSIILNLPIKLLCSEGCKGICPDCGKNLNNGECACNGLKIDPRLEKLKEYFKK